MMMMMMMMMGDARAAARFSSLRLREVPLRQDLALLDRRLVERIDAERVAGQDGLEHEMHHELADSALVEALDLHAPRRAAVLRQRVGGGAALRRDEVADAAPGKTRLAGAPRELRVDLRPLPRRADGQDREQLVLRPAKIELLLRVLVDRPDRGDRLRAL